MAGNDDGDRVGAHGLTDGPRLIGLPDRSSDLAVRGDMPVLDGQEMVVDLALEVGSRSGEVQLQVEGSEVLAEVGLELGDRVLQVLGPIFRRVRMTLPRQRTELDPTNARRGRPDGDGPGSRPGQVGGVDLDRGQFGSPPASFLSAS